MKQISLTIPENLFNLSKDYSQQFGYRSVQEFIIDLVRRKVVIDNVERYKEIENRMKKGKGVKKFTKAKAKEYLDNF